MVTEDAQTVSLDLKGYARTVRTQWLAVAACALLGLLVAGAYLLIVPQSVTATATLQLNLVSTDPFGAQRPASDLIDGATEVAVARSRVVAGAAEEALGGRLSADEIRDATSAEVPDGTTIMRIAFTARSANLAEEGADAVAEAYLAFQQQQADTRVDGMVSSLNERIEKLNTELVEANKEIASTADSGLEHAEALAQQQQVGMELQGLIASRSALQTVDTSSGAVLTSGADSRLDVSPRRSLVLLTGLVAGAVVGLVLAFARRPLVKHARSVGAVAGALAAPNLTHRTDDERIDLDETARLAWQHVLSAVPDPVELLVIEVGTVEVAESPAVAAALAEAISAHPATPRAGSVAAYLIGVGEARKPLSNAVHVRTMSARSGESALYAAIRPAQAVIVACGPGGAPLEMLRSVKRITSLFEVPILGCVEAPASPRAEEPEPAGEDPAEAEGSTASNPSEPAEPEK